MDCRNKCGNDNHLSMSENNTRQQPLIRIVAPGRSPVEERALISRIQYNIGIDDPVDSEVADCCDICRATTALKAAAQAADQFKIITQRMRRRHAEIPVL